MGRPLITVNSLLAMERHGEIVLPADALITPAAQDFLLGTRTPVRHVDAQPVISDQPKRYFCGDVHCPLIKTMLPGLQREYPNLAFSSCEGQVGVLLPSLTRICSGLSECNQRRAVVVVERTALVSCFANKYPKIRAAVAESPVVLFDLMRELELNLMILNPAKLALRQIRAMIDTFFAGKTSMAADVQAAFGDAASNLAEGTAVTACKCGG